MNLFLLLLWTMKYWLDIGREVSIPLCPCFWSRAPSHHSALRSSLFLSRYGGPPSPPSLSVILATVGELSVSLSLLWEDLLELRVSWRKILFDFTIPVFWGAYVHTLFFGDIVFFYIQCALLLGWRKSNCLLLRGRGCERLSISDSAFQRNCG